MLPVFAAARNLGFRITSEDDWSILWSFQVPWRKGLSGSSVLQERLKNYSSRSNKRVPPFAINHIPGLSRLASKLHLAQLSSSLGALHHAAAGIAPRVFVLPRQLKALRRDLRVKGVTDDEGLPRFVHKSVPLFHSNAVHASHKHPVFPRRPLCTSILYAANPLCLAH